MHAESIDEYRHNHVFLGAHHERNERKTWLVIALCGAMMAAEIGGGLLFGSMALIADGLHMSTHAGALIIAALAYAYARRHAHDERFSFGTGKLGDLAAFSSAIVLAMIAALIGYESILRLFHPVPIRFTQAIPIAVVGLGVNVLSAWLLRDEHHHDNDVEHHHADHATAADHHHDLNLRAAYVHVMADAAVSVLAVFGLVTASQLGWVWMDPLMGVVGACVIANWSWGLLRAAGAVLLDMNVDRSLTKAISERLEVAKDRVADLHLWRVGPGHFAAVVSIVSHNPQSPACYKARLTGLSALSHVTIEVETCRGPH
jgi:cation diffusion facilitator family transporter